MIPEIGHYALIMALCLAIVQSIVPLVGAQRGNAQWMALTRPSATGQFVFLSIAFFCLTYSFIQNDFSVLYVAKNSNTALPIAYRISAVWGAHEGSLLLWAYLLAGWTIAVAFFSRSLPQVMVARVISIMGMVSIGFLLFMILTSNPFDRLFPAALEGRDLNPLLQDPGLVIHPPMLYMGYVGFSVAFAFSIAALIGGNLDATWARWSRPWTTVAWSFLTLGIALGSWWAYYELGWGGWWFWDPVENASFMPWLVGTALIHSQAVTEKRSALKAWTVLLAIFAFSLSLLGTFLVRSGVLVSVHAFATDPARGTFILAFLVVVVGSSLALYAWRGPKVVGGGQFGSFSRETLLLVNNLLLVVTAITVLLGTLYPLIMDALGFGKISVGPPYFNMVFVPLMLPLCFLLGIGPLTRWKQDQPERVVKLMWRFLIAAFIIAVAFLFLYVAEIKPMVLLAVFVAAWVMITTGFAWYKQRNAGQRKSVTPAFLGMVMAHIGIGMFIIGVTLVETYHIEKDVKLEMNESIMMGEYEFKFLGTSHVDGPNYSAERGNVQVLLDNNVIATLYPEKRIYHAQRSPMTEAGIDPGLFRDLFVALGEPLDNGAWSLRVYYKPFIRWIWLGCLVMAIGGFIAVSDRRYRIRVQNKISDKLAAQGATA
ncbi:MAG: heme lyase CcmF/NrfE family subunit [Gammaproteobacteria bacterium]|nr:heme lyase CcmF/NrfE family subunit [Gammaproteobacteria bacterium]MDH5613421.1 heme lyase CcmF/NrfE family subunit [Gammaproteobacteria bacterium]